MKLLVLNDPRLAGYTFPFAPENARVCDAQSVTQALTSGSYDVLVNLHGEYFPEAAAPALVRFLQQGRGLVNVFAPPLQRLVTSDGRVGRARLAWLRKLRIHCVYPVAAQENGITHYALNEDNPAADALLPFLPVADTVTMQPIPATTKYVGSEWGSPGSMDVTVTPLVRGLNAREEQFSAPVVLYEHRAGAFAGGRWVFVNQAVETGCEQALEVLAQYAARGERSVSVAPLLPFYDAEERPRLMLQAQSSRVPTVWRAGIRVLRGESVEYETQAEIAGGPYNLRAELPPMPAQAAGEYTVVSDCRSADGERRILLQGFCVRDARRMSALPRIGCKGEYFRLHGRVSPVVGSTYMSSGVSRAFLHLPNPGEWLRDMRRMREQGIAWIRTGMWCHQHAYMQEDGHVDERILRSVDAFLQCAAAAGLYVTFTFFTFCPLLWEGTHPYLDRRAVSAQQRLIMAVAQRHAQTTHVDWDLLNEPYWSDHPMGKTAEDHTEEEAFRAYMRGKYPDAFTLNETLDLAAGGADVLPLPHSGMINFDVLDMNDCKNGLIWQDYKRFQVAEFKKWVRGTRALLKQLNPDFMVTFGQDEGLRAHRPAPLDFGDVMDYTTVHPWSGVDDVAWNIALSKVYGLPHMAQETGLFYTENPDSRPRYTQRENRLLLQRKYAAAYGLGCAGVLHWLWNTNIYMNSANEAHIGAVHAEGSAKPEMLLSREFSSFFSRAQHCFSAHTEPPRIALIFSFTNDFSNRPFAGRASLNASNALHYELRMRYQAVSEYAPQTLRALNPALVIVPGAHQMHEESAQALFEVVADCGATLLWHGPLHLDAHFALCERLPALPQGALRPLARYECLRAGEVALTLRFDDGYASTAFCETATADEYVELPLGKGRLLWSGIPVELCAERGQIAEIYRHALRRAGVEQELTAEGGEGVFTSVVRFERARMYTAINENGREARLILRDAAAGTAYAVRLPALDCEMWICDDNGLVSSLHGTVQQHDE